MEIKILETIGVNSLKKQLSLLLATGAAAVGLYFAGYTYADASSTITVKAGDTVAKLATEYNDTVNGIKQRNNLADANLIVVGQQLKVGADNNTANTTTNYNYSTPKTSTASYSYSAPQKTTTTNYSYVTPKAKTSYTAKSNTNYSTSGNYATTSSNTSANSTSSSYTSSASGSDASAKAWIANKESGGSYSATNGQYIGKYQLSSSYLNGDYSAANQEKVADKYVASRYGSWSAAKAFWQANGWY
ncbi:LysM domain protein [Lentilactobacillus senioris DSM 24302 = JCM 17472]|uniref:LysM domain protein n=1 Tax=Lentilactobacillus senioris DSM 24302 = JCM 17472 TaxID=1423802 RepID=A0A0R2CRT4_9LACO|nr:LysM domain protein [Lentilactobacillus senioris DSM 24302 = JCM 17472]